MTRYRTAAIALAAVVALLAGVAVAAAAYPRPGRTKLVSVASDGSQANWHSTLDSPATISADGRFVVFSTRASNLVPGDTNEATDVFVHDRDMATTERVSVASDGSQGEGDSFLSPLATISADGRYVAFRSAASDLVPGATTGGNVFVHDRTTGATEVVPGHGDSPSISADGRYVAFVSFVSDVVAEDTNGAPDVFVHDRDTETTERVSVAGDGSQANTSSDLPSISADGRYVAFGSGANNLVEDDTNAAWDVFVRDRDTGTTERVSVASDGSQAQRDAGIFVPHPSISADGRYVAFRSGYSDLVPADTNRAIDVFVHDRDTGTTERVSVSSDGRQSDANSATADSPAISADGRYVAFWSPASTLVPRDINRVNDAFVHDRVTGITERVSVADDGSEGNGKSFTPSLSADGRYVAFFSVASNLVPGQTAQCSGFHCADVFVHDRGPAVGVGELSAVAQGDRISVSGWATFSGQVVASADDSPDDGAPGAQATGAELTRASITYRTEQEDLQVRLRLASLPGLLAAPEVTPTIQLGGGVPGALYGLEFDLGEIRHEVRALWAGATGQSPALPYFAVYRCDPDCTEHAGLKGAIGTTGDEVVVSVPLSTLGAAEGASLEQIRAFTAAGEAAPGALVAFDEVDLADTTIPGAQVSLGIAPAGTPEGEVTFDIEAALTEGRLSGTVDVSSLPAGSYDVWAKGCLGEVCGAATAPVTLGAGPLPSPTPSATQSPSPAPTPTETVVPSQTPTPTEPPGERGTYPNPPNDPYFAPNATGMTSPTQWSVRKIKRPRHGRRTAPPASGSRSRCSTPESIWTTRTCSVPASSPKAQR